MNQGGSSTIWKDQEAMGTRLVGLLSYLTLPAWSVNAKTQVLIHSIKGGRLHEPKIITPLRELTIAIVNYSVT